MHCVGCGASIPEEASFCPKCGRQTSTSAATASPAQLPPSEPEKKKGNKALGCFVIGAVILLVLYLIGSSVDPADQNKVASASAGSAIEGSSETEPDVLPLAVTATELFKAYESNEASAQSYFGGRQLLVSGTVRKVSLDFSDDPVVELETPNQFMSASANLAEDAHDQAGNFSVGDKVKLLCEDVSEVMAIPQLKNCRTAPAGQKSEPIEWKK